VDARDMVVARLHGARDLRLGREPVPEPGSREVLLRLGAVGICGSDVHWYQDAQIGNRHITQPFILGHEFSGVVMAAGAGTTGLPPGTRVVVEPALPCASCATCQEGNQNLCPYVRFCGSPPQEGALREYMVMPAHNCIPLPEVLSLAEGALIETLGVAIHAVDLGHVRLAARVAVFGAGAVGLLVAQAARLAGAVDVFISEPLEHRRALAGRLGLTPVDAAGDPVGAILALTGGRGVDVAFECAGATITAQESCDVCRPGGSVVIVGIPCDDRADFTSSPLRAKGLTVRFAQRSRRTTHRALILASRGLVDLGSLISHEFVLDKAPDAFILAERRDEGAVKVVVRVGA
jgi:L-iditol 2-dehydrogenase